MVTFFRKGLLRNGDMFPSFRKLLTIEITIGALLLGMGPHLCHLNKNSQALALLRPANCANHLQYTVCKAMQYLWTQYFLMLVYLGHLVRQCKCTGEIANTGSFAFEGLQIVMCLLVRLNMGEPLLKYERAVATVLLPALCDGWAGLC